MADERHFSGKHIRIGRWRLNKPGPLGRALAECAGCERLVHSEIEFGAFCCVDCCQEYWGLAEIDSLGHGNRCEGDLAANVDPAQYRDAEGNPDPTFQVADPNVLPYKSAVQKKKLRKKFEERLPWLQLQEPGEEPQPEPRPQPEPAKAAPMPFVTQPMAQASTPKAPPVNIKARVDSVPGGVWNEPEVKEEALPAGYWRPAEYIYERGHVPLGEDEECPITASIIKLDPKKWASRMFSSRQGPGYLTTRRRLHFLRMVLMSRDSCFQSLTYYHGGLAGSISEREEILDRLLSFLFP